VSAEESGFRRRVGLIGTLIILAVYGGLALSVDFRTAAGGFQSDEATYHLMGHSLAADGDLEYRAEDLVRAFREFDSGPSGIFLKRGVDVERVRLSSRLPFVEFPGRPDPDTSRLYFGKSFIYPLVAAPAVRLLGTNGFLLLNALLIAAAFLAVYTFTSARSGALAGALWSSAFVFASVVPVYTVWIAPELFNWALTVIAYFLWLYKIATPAGETRPSSGLRGPWTDVAAAAVIGVLTYSKVTNVLLLLPILAWYAWTRAWSRLMWTTAACGLLIALCFGANVAVTGEWNYQGGDRRTCYGPYPFQTSDARLEVCDERGRGEALWDIIFDKEVFGTNLRANLVYFFVGRNSGLLPYYFPAVFAALALVVAARRRAAWQWFVLGGIVIQILFFVVTIPYSYFGGGGTVGNRYFIGVYGACAYLLPALASLRWMTIPWAVGGLFVAKLILNPFQVSIQPADHAKSGLYRWLPVEITNLNDLPLMTEAERTRIWYGNSGAGDPGFQVYYLDDNSYLQEADRLSFWVRGQSRAEFAIKTDKPYSRLRVTLTAGPQATRATVRVSGKRTTVDLAPGQSSQVYLSLGPGFPYKKDRPTPAYVWIMDVSSSTGFVPAIAEGSEDRRFLGVRVQPIILE
jgi:hypothetical protein